MMSVTGFIFSLETARINKGTILRLKVNFTPEIIMLTKEVLIFISPFALTIVF